MAGPGRPEASEGLAGHDVLPVGAGDAHAVHVAVLVQQLTRQHIAHATTRSNKYIELHCVFKYF